MKVKIKDGGKVVREEELRNLMHFETQLKNRKQVFRSKKGYTRKVKHKSQQEN